MVFCTPSWLLTTVFYGLHVYVDYIFCLKKSLTLCSLSRQAPSSLLEALEQHLASLEGKKVKDSTAASRYINPLIFALDHSNYLNIYIRSVILTYLCCTASCVNLFPCRASTLSNAVSSLASTGMSFTKVDEREKQAALEEEQARLKALKVNAFLKRKMKHYFTWHALNLPSVGFFFFDWTSLLIRNKGLKSSPRGLHLPRLIHHQSPPLGALSAQHQPLISSLHPAAPMGTA